jgi:hypothetical protein
LVTNSGIPKYLIRNWDSQQGRRLATMVEFSSEHQIVVTVLLFMLQPKPEAPSKMLKITLISSRSPTTGDKKMIKSLAYKEAMCGKPQPRNWLKRDQASAFWISAPNTSITRRNNMEERGSP